MSTSLTHPTEHQLVDRVGSFDLENRLIAPSMRVQLGIVSRKVIYYDDKQSEVADGHEV